jgi:hypothetical protein
MVKEISWCEYRTDYDIKMKEEKVTLIPVLPVIGTYYSFQSVFEQMIL